MNLANRINGGHDHGVVENQESIRRWSGYVCPDCRFVFRVARDHDGKGVVCPSCHRLLKIPGPDDVVPPLLVEQLLRDPGDVEMKGGDFPEKGSLNVRKKGKRKKRVGETIEWEKSGRWIRRGEGRYSLYFMVAGLLLLVAIVTAVVYTAMDVKTTGDEEAGGSMDGSGFLEELPEIGAAGGDMGLSGDLVRPSQSSGHVRLLSDAHPVARAFLEATTVEKLLKVVDRPDVVSERIKRYYPDGVIDPPGLGDYSQFSQVRMVGPYGVIPLRTRDFKVRLMTFRLYSDELKVDWESWVGWSEIPWEEFIRDRPGGEHVFRVNLAAVEYYNFDFSDDRRWQSFRLISPDEKHSLYGYVSRDTPAHIALRSVLEAGFAQVMVELRFVEGAGESDQVEITRIIAENWIDPERLSEP